MGAADYLERSSLGDARLVRFLLADLTARFFAAFFRDAFFRAAFFFAMPCYSFNQG